MTDVSCKNCGTALTAEYCPNCGQRNIDLERPLASLVGEVVHETFDFDGRAFRTIWTLFRWPGLLTREFLAGYRKKYTPPFRLYLVISILFFLVAAWTAGRGFLLSESQTQADDAIQQARFVSDEFPKFMIVLLPAFALLLKAAFPARLYFDHLIYSLHVHSASFVMLAFLLPLEQAANQHWLPLVAQVSLLIWILLYAIFSMRRVYQTGWFAAVSKSIAILFVYLILIGSTVKLTDLLKTI